MLKPGDAAYAHLKFGQPNQLSVQARGADRDAGKLRGKQRFIDQLDLGPPVGPHIPIHAVGSVDDIARSIVMQLRADLALPSTA